MDNPGYNTPDIRADARRIQHAAIDSYVNHEKGLLSIQPSSRPLNTFQWYCAFFHRIVPMESIAPPSGLIMVQAMNRMS
jgi:hypothetical protein